MEDLLAQERAAYSQVQHVFGNQTEPFANLFGAMSSYRDACVACIFADFLAPETRKVEARLWAAHSLAKNYFHRALSGLRKGAHAQPVEIRQLMTVYKQFVKTSQIFYREYVYRLSVTFGGIPELEEVAQHVRTTNGTQSESSQAFVVSPELQGLVLYSTHQILVYLGDLSRYRASEKLDKQPDFGPAIGYYGLACTLRPNSGLGHHQQAVVALEQRHHLRAIYHLYRAMCVEEPHPNAANNLKLEFDKINLAWDRGELIQKGLPNDPDATKRALIGWFTRLHSMCYKGDEFRGHEELEREVLSQLSAVLKQRALDTTFFRMVLTNLAAQGTSVQNFQATPTPQLQQSLFYFLRINIKTFSTLLTLFCEGLQDVYRSLVSDDDAELAARLEPVARRTLPGLRLYSSWVFPNMTLLTGLADDDFLSTSIEQMWRAYAKTLTVVAEVFPIWDLEELPEVTYLLEEDVDTLGFAPLMDVATKKLWYDKETGRTKPRFSDQSVQRLSLSDEMLARVKDFLSTGLDIATTGDAGPIKLKGTKIVYGDEEPPPQPAQSVAAPKQPVPAKPVGKAQSKKAAVPTKPTSWANIAANGHAKDVPKPAAKPAGKPANDPKGTTKQAPPPHSRHAQLSRMVDDLVDDEDGNDPITPPQPHSVNPAVVAANGDVVMQGDNPTTAKVSATRPSNNVSQPATPSVRINGSTNNSTTTTPLAQHSLSSIWDNLASNNASSSFPSGLPMGTLSSPVHMNGRAHGHSRVNSASSIRSRGSPMMVESWSSIDSSPNAQRDSAAHPAASYANGYVNLDHHGIASPLLFGASGGPWSTGPRRSFSNNTPPNGQGQGGNGQG